MTTRLVNLVLFQDGWYACVLGAARAALGASSPEILAPLRG